MNSAKTDRLAMDRDRYQLRFGVCCAAMLMIGVTHTIASMFHLDTRWLASLPMFLLVFQWLFLLTIFFRNAMTQISAERTFLVAGILILSNTFVFSYWYWEIFLERTGQGGDVGREQVIFTATLPAALSLFPACVFLYARTRDVSRIAMVLGGLHFVFVAWFWNDEQLIWRLFWAGLLTALLIFGGYALVWFSHFILASRLRLSPILCFKDQLENARAIHESLFPEPARGKQFQFGYAYRPAREIGGDFVFVHTTPQSNGKADPERIHMVLIDVTGHGVSSALAVNRLSGELQRIFADNQDLCPVDVLARLNHYILHTLAKHMIYATAVSIRADFVHNRAAVANAGHPECFLFRKDSVAEDVESNVPMLGVFDADAFEVEPTMIDFYAGDQMVLVTDGATEAKNAAGRMLGTKGIRQIIEESCKRRPILTGNHQSGRYLQERIRGRLLERDDLRKPVGLVQRVMRQKLMDHPSGLADEILVSVSEYGERTNDDDILIATLERMRES